MDNNLLKSNFIGRDGFRWWIGQVAPEEAQGDQLNQIGSTWGCRLKVRIMGYHPQNTVELADEDLPWAQVLLSPQGGSGKANRSRSLRISPGDNVFGFFLDGDAAQIPVIIGIFGNTTYSPSGENSGPFIPFTGYTSKIKASDYMIKGEAGDQSGKTAQRSPRNVSKRLAEEIEKKTGLTERSVSSAVGKVVNFGGTNTNSVDKVKNEVENALLGVSTATAKEKNSIIDSASRKITGIASGLSGSFINKTYADLSPKLNTGLHNLYKDVYGKILLATQNGAIAKKAANIAQVAMVGPVTVSYTHLTLPTKRIV